MFGTQKFVITLVLIATVSIALSNHLDRGTFFGRVLQNTKALLSSKVPYVKHGPPHSYTPVRNGTLYTSAANNYARGWSEEPEGGGGGWDGGWAYSHSTHSKGLDLNAIIGGLSLLGLLGVALYGFTRPAPTTMVMMMNGTGRKRRSADDFGDEDIEGETMPEFLARIGEYFERSWGGKTEKKIDQVQLY